jgi:hypothetical protein
MYGIRLSLVSEKSAALPAGCIASGLRSAGLAADALANNQLGIRDVGAATNDPSRYWFMADVSKPNQIDFYSLHMHEPIPCDSLVKFIPRMREAAQKMQTACSLSGDDVVVKEKWTQDRCGT